MITVSSGDLQRNFGLYQDMALTQPVSVTRNGRERIVLLSADEYRRLKRRSRKVFLAEELDTQTVEAIANSKMDERHAHLDYEDGLK